MKATFRLRMIRHMQRKENIKREKERDGLYRDIDEELDINYAGDSDPRHTLDYYSPKNVGTTPVIIVYHGGGYIANEKGLNRVQARWFATNGYKVINGEYTLYPEGDSRMQMQEVAQLIKWVEMNAVKYGFNLNHVYMTGDSAGGHLVMLYAMIQGNQDLQKYFDVNMPKTEIKAVAASCPMDEVEWCEKGQKPTKENINPFFFKQMFHGKADRDFVAHLNLKTHILNSAFPPLFVLTTPSDDLLGKYTKRLKEPLEKSCREYKYKEYYDQANKLEHVFNVTWPEWEESIEANTDIVNFFKQY